MATSPLRLLSTEQLRELPPTQNLSGTHLVSGGLNVIFGPSGTFKSFYALGVALEISQQQPVIYIAAEGSGGLYRRVEAWSTYHRRPSRNIAFVCQEVNLLRRPEIEQFVKSALKVKPALVVFDTLARCASGGDENSVKDMGIAIENAALIQRAVGTAVGWVHHSNRADRGERGSGAIRGAADAMIEISASGDGLVRVSCSKVKDSEPWEPDSLVFHPVGESGVLLRPTSSTLVSLSLTPTEKSIMEFMHLSVFETRGAQTLQIVNSLNISERHVYRVLSGLKNKGLARHVRNGAPMELTEVGSEILSTFADTTAPLRQPVADIEVDVDN